MSQLGDIERSMTAPTAEEFFERECLSLQRAGELLIQPPDSRFPLGIVRLHLFVLWPSDRGNCLVFCCASSYLFLNGIANIHQHLSKPAELLTSFLRVYGNGTVPWNEDVRGEGLDCIQRLQPVKAVTVIDKQNWLAKNSSLK